VAEEDMLAGVMRPGAFVREVAEVEINRRIGGKPHQSRRQDNSEENKHETDLTAP
jgi:hypothetical protein